MGFILFQGDLWLICLVDTCTLKCFIMINVILTLAIKYGMRNTHCIKESQLTKISRKTRCKGNLIFPSFCWIHFLVEDFQMLFWWFDTTIFEFWYVIPYKSLNEVCFYLSRYPYFCIVLKNVWNCSTQFSRLKCVFFSS